MRVNLVPSGHGPGRSLNGNREMSVIKVLDCLLVVESESVEFGINWK